MDVFELTDDYLIVELPPEITPQGVALELHTQRGPARRLVEASVHGVGEATCDVVDVSSGRVSYSIRTVYYSGYKL